MSTKFGSILTSIRSKPLLTFLCSVVVVLGISLGVSQSQLVTYRSIINDVWDKANHRLMLSAWTGGLAANTTFETETTIFNDVWDQANHFLKTNGAGGGGGTGDFSSNTSTAVDSEVVLFSGTGGKVGKRASGTGYATLTAGVLGATTDVATLAQINGFTGRQDAGNAASTAPNKKGTTLPGVCNIGDTFFKTDAAAGSNMYLCTATNTWTQLVVGGDFSSNTTTAVDGELVLFNGITGKQGRRATGTGYALLNNGVLGISTDVASLSSTNTLLGRQNAGGAISTAPNKVGTGLPGSCIVGDTFYKSDATAGSNIYGCTAPNVWTVEGGGGVGTGDVSSNTSTSVDGEVMLFNGTTGKSAKRAVGTGYTTLTNGVLGTTTDVATLTQMNNFTGRQNAGNAASTAPHRLGSVLPASCIVGDTFFKIDATAGQNTYACTGANSWTLQGDGVGSGGGGGDFSSNTATSVDGEVVLFSGGGGKTGKRASTTGIPKLTAGVLSTATPGTDYALPNANTTGQANTALAFAADPINCAAGLVMLGSGINAAGVPEACSALSAINVQNSTYQVTATDFNTYAMIPVSAGTFTITLVASGAQPAPGKYIWISNYGSGVITIARSGQTINGQAANLTLAAGSASAPNAMFIMSDGVNYIAVPFGGTTGGGGSGTVSGGAVNQTARYTGTGTTVGPSTGIQLSSTDILTVKNNVTTISTNTTLDQQNIIRCVAGGGTVTLTLPSANTTTVGRYTIAKDDATGICQIARAGSDTFNGLAGPIVISKRFDAVILELYDNGSPGVWWYTAAKAQYGYHALPIKAADLPTSNAGVIDLSEPRPKILFDATTPWCVSWTFSLNPDYGTGAQLVFNYSAVSATSGTMKFDVSVWKTTSLQAEDVQIAGYDTVNTATDTVPGTAGRVSEVTLPLVNTDSMVANDLVTVKGCRNTTGTATGNMELLSAQLQYFKQ
jgi:hypothetical protein